MISVSDSHWSEELVGVSVEELHVWAGLDLVWLPNLHASSMGNCWNLNLVVSFLVSEEHLSKAIVQKILSFLFSHVCSPSILEQNLAVMQTKTSSNKVLILNFSAMEVWGTKENFVSLLIDSSDNNGNE